MLASAIEALSRPFHSDFYPSLQCIRSASLLDFFQGDMRYPFAKRDLTDFKITILYQSAIIPLSLLALRPVVHSSFAASRKILDVAAFFAFREASAIQAYQVNRAYCYEALARTSILAAKLFISIGKYSSGLHRILSRNPRMIVPLLIWLPLIPMLKLACQK